MANAIEIEVPDIGNYSGVPVIEILIKPGDSVKKDQGIVTLESDKATMEVPSPAAGVIKEIKVKLGDEVGEGALIALLESAEAATAAPAPAQAAKAAPAPVAAAPAPSAAPAPKAAAASGRTADFECQEPQCRCTICRASHAISKSSVSLLLGLAVLAALSAALLPVS